MRPLHPVIIVVAAAILFTGCENREKSWADKMAEGVQTGKEASRLTQQMAEFNAHNFRAGGPAANFLTRFNELLQSEQDLPTELHQFNSKQKNLLLKLLRKYEPELATRMGEDELDIFLRRHGWDTPDNPFPPLHDSYAWGPEQRERNWREARGLPEPSPALSVPDKAQSCAEYVADYVRHIMDPQKRLDQIQDITKSQEEDFLTLANKAFGVDLETASPEEEQATLERMTSAMAKYHPELDWLTAVHKAMGEKVGQHQQEAQKMLVALYWLEIKYWGKEIDGKSAEGFWTGDVNSLYLLMSRADNKGKVAVFKPNGELEIEDKPYVPDQKYYVLQPVPLDETGTPYGKDTVGGEKRLNRERFAYCAYPRLVGFTGRETYFVDEGGIIWFADTAGKPVGRRPKDFVAEGWTKAEDQPIQRQIEQENAAAVFAAKHKFVPDIDGDPAREINNVVFSPDGKRVLTGADFGPIVVWAAATSEGVLNLNEERVAIDPSMAFSSDGSHVITNSYKGVAKLWDAATGQEVRKIGQPDFAVDSVAFSPDGHDVLTGSEYGHMAILWDAGTGQKVHEFSGPDANYSNRLSSVAFSANGKRFLTCSEFGVVNMLDAATGEVVKSLKLSTFSGKTRNVVAFSADGAWALGVDAEGNANLWNTATGQNVRKFGRDGPDMIASVAFSLDGAQVLTGTTQGHVILWDAATGQKIRIFGRRMLWDAGELGLLRENDWLSSLATVNSVAFSPDGKLILAGAGTAILWDAVTGEELAQLMTWTSGKDWDWLVVTPTGLFDGSEGGQDKLTIRIPDVREAVTFPGEKKPAKSFPKLNRPGLLGALLQGERPIPDVN